MKIVPKLRASFDLSFLICLLWHLASGQATSDAKLSIDERVFTATKVHSLMRGYFFSPKEPPGASLDDSYKAYLRTALASEDRRQFDLATIEFVAQLHNGHTFFWDTWLDKSNQPLGFYANSTMQPESLRGCKYAPGDHFAIFQ